MMKIARNIYVLIVVALVLFLTIGSSISKMQCDKGFSFYLGNEVKNCNIEENISCNVDTEKEFCCKKEAMQKSCCPTTDGCDKDTKFLQFTFEIVVAKKHKITDCKEIFLFEITQNNLFESVHDNLITHCQVELPPLLAKPIFSEIQNFIL